VCYKAEQCSDDLVTPVTIGAAPDYEPIHVGWRMSTSQHKWLARCRDGEGSGS
jgi:hypothetical protein